MSATILAPSRADEGRRPARTTDVILTGDRPTGSLHLGHYAGSLRSRLVLQGQCAQTLLIADLQALTDSSGRAADIARHVTEVALDYLAVGIDPAQTTIAVQSRLSALAELTVMYLNLVTVARLERNPTVKAEVVMEVMLAGPLSVATLVPPSKSTLAPDIVKLSLNVTVSR